MNIKVVMGHYTNYSNNRFQAKTVDRVINTTANMLISGRNDVTEAIARFWDNNSSVFMHGKFVDYYEVPDVFQPELLTEIKDGNNN